MNDLADTIITEVQAMVNANTPLVDTRDETNIVGRP
jgi:hypothetical protein